VLQLIVIALLSSYAMFATAETEPNMVQSWEKQRQIRAVGAPSAWHTKKQKAIDGARYNAKHKLYNEAERICPKGIYDWDTKSITYVDYEFGRDINKKWQQNQYKFKAQAYAWCNKPK